MADAILKLSRSIFKKSVDRDFVSDQIHHQISFTLLIIFAVTSTTLQFYADPIQCIQPAQFTEGYTSFARALCWLNNTYFYPQTYTRVPIDRSKRSEQTLRYYQWLPFVYLIQAFLFLVPYLIWISLYQRNGLSPKTLIDQAKNKSTRSEANQRISKEIERYLMCRQLARCKRKLLFRQNLNNDDSSASTPLVLPRVSIMVKSHGCYLTFLYLFVKLLYIVNIIVQIIGLNAIVSTGNYGFFQFGIDTTDFLLRTSFKERLSSLSHQHQQLFPFVTLCDFHIRELGQDHHYTIECILLINIFYEKIYYVIWLWYVFLLFFSIFSLVNSICSFVPFCSRRRFISKMFDLIQSKREQTYSPPTSSIVEHSTENRPEPIDQFLQDKQRRSLFTRWLQLDGHFIVNLLETHAGQPLLLRTLEDLIQIWIERYEDQSKLAERLLKNQFQF